MTMPNLESYPVEERQRVNGQLNGAEQGVAFYKRYDLSAPDGISPISVPGKDRYSYVATGLEHDEHCEHSIDPENHVAMTEKRYAKLQAAMRDLPPAPIYGDPTAEIGLLGWGSTEGPIREAIEQAAAKGIKAAALHPRVLSPLPEDQIRTFIQSKKHVIVVEHNYTGQFARHLGGLFGFIPERLNKYGGLPFMPGEILRKIEEVASA
jgi:2-oxoglutarate ferredoxin oxidoreductase subunit alpha